MEDKDYLYIGLAVISIPTYLYIAKIVFGDLRGFLDNLTAAAKSENTSEVNIESEWAMIKLIYFLIFCVVAVYVESVLLVKFFPGIANVVSACTEGIMQFMGLPSLK